MWKHVLKLQVFWSKQSDVDIIKVQVIEKKHADLLVRRYKLEFQQLDCIANKNIPRNFASVT